MVRITPLVFAALLATVACQPSRGNTPVETQPGAAADLNKPPQAGGASHLAQLDPEKGEFADDIIYASADGPSPFAHPLCANTWRNGKKLGDETSGPGN